jgi:protein tyrosine/serine phosphatase
MRLLLIVGLIVPMSAFAFGGARASAKADLPIERFSEVSPGIYRGARPDQAGLQYLAGLKVQYDLDLEDNDAAVASEAGVVPALGIALEKEPLSGFWAPNDAQVDRILAYVADPSHRPLFIHCTHGEDRTGLIVGLYRILYEHVDPKTAYQEALDHGFHKILFPLNHYFEEKGGFED